MGDRRWVKLYWTHGILTALLNINYMYICISSSRLLTHYLVVRTKSYSLHVNTALQPRSDSKLCFVGDSAGRLMA